MIPDEIQTQCYERCKLCQSRAKCYEALSNLCSVLAKKKPGGRPPGRPRRQDIDEAMRMTAEGLSPKEIYRRLNRTSRDEQCALREAMRQRRRRQRLLERKTAEVKG